MNHWIDFWLKVLLTQINRPEPYPVGLCPVFGAGIFWKTGFVLDKILLIRRVRRASPAPEGRQVPRRILGKAVEKVLLVAALEQLVVCPLF